MARNSSTHPTDTELEILQLLWDSGPCSLSDLCALIRKTRPVATTTVSTMLKVMQDKKLVMRQAGDPGTRGATWKAKVNRKQAARGFVSKVVDRIFEGSAQQLVAHIISDRKLSESDRKAIQKLLDETPEDKK